MHASYASSRVQIANGAGTDVANMGSGLVEILIKPRTSTKAKAIASSGSSVKGREGT